MTRSLAVTAMILTYARGLDLPMVGQVVGWVLLLPLMMLPGLRESWWKDSPPLYHEAATPIAATEWLFP